ncbi:MAG: NADH-quinone oxidoreductase subunit N [Myxococcota bacterium]
MTPFPAPAFDLRALEPLLVVVGTALLVLVLDLLLPRRTRASLAMASIAGMLLAMLASLLLSAEAPLRFMTDSPSMMALDTYAIFFNLLILAGGILTILASVNYLEEMQSHHGEYYVLVLCAVAGMMTMAAATDLITVFLGLEVMSIPVYILAGFTRQRVRSNEAALKYFLLGAFATGLLLYGIALIYGAAGSTDLAAIRAGWEPTPLGLAGLGLVLVGFGFKVSSVPFHMWTPDVYEGAPTPITGFMAVGVKAAAFAAFLRVFLVAFDISADKLNVLLWVLALATMTVGNVAAIAQSNIKRMLAYSSIAHAGYVLVGMVAGTPAGQAAVLYYLLVYTFMNLGAFAVIILRVQDGEEREEIEDLAGLGYGRPALGLAMTLFMLSLGGIPPTAGFMGKFYIFRAAVEAGYYWLVIFAILNAVISMYYYLRVITVMYSSEPARDLRPAAPSTACALALAVSALATLLLGVFSRAPLDIALQSVSALFS